MSQIVQYKLPCPNKACGSSDAYHIWDDGHGYCFSCEYRKPPNQQEVLLSDEAFTFEYLPWRGISKETMAFFRLSTKVDVNGKPVSIACRFPNGAAQIRFLDKKEFLSQGPASEPSLIFADRFPAGSAKSITITEGWLDAASAYQMLGAAHPVVSVRSGSSAVKDCGAYIDYLNTFERINLAFDDDKVGQTAAQKVAGLFDFNKVYSLKLAPFKDANDFLTSGKDKEFRNVWLNAKRFLPEGIVSSKSDFDRIIDDSAAKPSIPWPFKSLNEKTSGIRQGEFILLTAQEGIGKTEIIRRIEHHILTTTNESIGAIHLEEPKDRQLKGLASYELGTPAHLPESHVSHDEIKRAIGKIVSDRDDRLHIYSHFGSDDPDILLDIIRFLVVACGCKYIFLDHITMVVTGLESDDERRTLDYLSTRLATLVHDLNFTLFCVSHVNDDGKTRGSRNIGKVADLRVDLNRNLLAESEHERNLTYLTIAKNRFSGKTGPAGVLAFDPTSFTIADAVSADAPVPVN